MGIKCWGKVAKFCPAVSRWLFSLLGILQMVCCFVAIVVCKPEEEWTYNDGKGELQNFAQCSVPPQNQSADTKRTTILIGTVWILTCLCGMRVTKCSCSGTATRAEMPFMYTPVPAAYTDTTDKVTDTCAAFTKFCH